MRFGSSIYAYAIHTQPSERHGLKSFKEMVLHGLDCIL